MNLGQHINVPFESGRGAVSVHEKMYLIGYDVSSAGNEMGGYKVVRHQCEHFYSFLTATQLQQHNKKTF
jgi:hypothetical protein